MTSHRLLDLVLALIGFTMGWFLVDVVTLLYDPASREP